MKILIAGAGKVGSTVARQLASEGHDLTLIDSKQEVLERWRREHPRKKEEPPSAVEKTIMGCPGAFFFEMETCAPTAATTTAVMNRLYGR